MRKEEQLPKRCQNRRTRKHPVRGADSFCKKSSWWELKNLLLITWLWGLSSHLQCSCLEGCRCAGEGTDPRALPVFIHVSPAFSARSNVLRSSWWLEAAHVGRNDIVCIQILVPDTEHDNWKSFLLAMTCSSDFCTPLLLSRLCLAILQASADYRIWQRSLRGYLRILLRM